MRKTKVVCTLGPSSERHETLVKMVQAGMNVARINFSHGAKEIHRQRIEKFRQVGEQSGRYLALLVDTRGPEMRIKSFGEDYVELQEGQDFSLTTRDITGDTHKVSVTYQGLPDDVPRGASILLDDGAISLEVVDITADEVRCRVVDGGILRSNKGMNIPGVHLNLPVISPEDRSDITFALNLGVDYIAASFIRNREDVLDIRNLVEKEGQKEVKIIAKIENQQGVDNFSSILEVADGVMVARGDLGVEIPAEDVPLVQKSIIEYCNRAGKPVITATQMLESMMENPRPTRAEASDVANAIFDGTDAVMLSGETAVGDYPVETAETMCRIAERTEKGLQYEQLLQYFEPIMEKTVTDAISYATCHTSQELGASAIITSTQSGYTARMVSKYRPRAPIVAVTPVEEVARSLTLSWGVYPTVSPPVYNTDEMFKLVVETALNAGLINMGDLVVITAGLPVGVSGTTNFLRVETVGEIIARGTGIGKTSVIGKARLVKGKEDLPRITREDILVAPSTDKNMVPYLEKARGMVTEVGGLTSHAAIMAVNLGIPAIVGVENATGLISEGEFITLDSLRGQLYRGRATVL